MKDMPAQYNRRDFLRTAGAVTVAVSATHGKEDAKNSEGAEPIPCLFSKPLHNRRFDELPPLLHELGVKAVDLTCRPKGHVLPERVTEDLPKAVELLRKNGIAVPMLTTGILDADKGHAEEIVKTAGSLGIKYAKLGYYMYGDLKRIPQTLADVKRRLTGVAALFKQYGVHAGFHNHSGKFVGSAMWDVWQLIKDLPPEAVGSYFDIRHATTEGGLSGWAIGMNLLISRITMVAVKDFVWAKFPKKGWRPDNVPLGKGMTRLEPAFKRLKEADFAGPIAMHMEYGEHTPPVGSDADKANLQAIRNDMKTLNQLLIKTGLCEEKG
jgi:sugar phosphate isomerase/epimerase